MATFDTELSRYLNYVTEVTEVGGNDETGIQLWTSHQGEFPQLAPLAVDLLSMPASQAFVERIFSLCGQQTTGKRNRARTTLARRVFFEDQSSLIATFSAGFEETPVIS